MKTVLVPTDFSKAACNAADYAVKLAREIKANVLLLHAYHLPIQVTDLPELTINPIELQKEYEIEIKKEALRLSEMKGVEVNYLLETGYAVETILAEEKNAFLIVMGMKGTGLLSEVLMGSNTTALLQKTHKPVLVIPENAKYNDPENLVYACDYESSINEKAIEALKCFTMAFGSRIMVLHVKPEKSLIASQSARKAQIEGQLKDLNTVYYFLEGDDPVEGIHEFVMEHHADIVAMMPHRYHLLDRLFHKSISKKMAFHTEVPLLALPDKHKTGEVFFF